MKPKNKFTLLIQGQLCKKIIELAKRDDEPDLGYWTRKYLSEKLGIKRKCLFCKKPFDDKKETTKFCSESCRQKSYRRNKK